MTLEKLQLHRESQQWWGDDPGKVQPHSEILLVVKCEICEDLNLPHPVIFNTKVVEVVTAQLTIEKKSVCMN